MHKRIDYLLLKMYYSMIAENKYTKYGIPRTFLIGILFYLLSGNKNCAWTKR